ncbi:AMP-binding protein [Tistrella mobilis]|uniref:3-methylmercaptopropionyl-CoA ligase n=1 Tax=Tistrella mobilis (strain KA081020-065) TaxID=1110502 RepID=I3TS98_TISMK|nr:AMP-binding protein [Tistrella mobilis]AFK55636.1 Acyl-CoA synthetase (AMP-forming)/AMP-acid ligase II [Tistrella mobilis KA081020-065]
MRLIDFFDRGAAINPDGVCLEDDEVSRSYRCVQTRSFRFANAIAAEGFGPGRMAGIYSPNCVSGFEAMLGLFRSGTAWVPVNAKNGVDENAYILDHNDVEILFYHSSFEAALDRIKALCPKIRRFICLDRAGSDGPWLEDWLADAADTDPDVTLGPDDLVGILSSGGTTGRPKGIMLTQLNWGTMIANFYAGVDPGPAPVHLLVTPMTHAAGVMAIVLMAAGARNIILPGFDAARVLDTIAREEVTHLFLPPTAIYMLLSEPGIEDRGFPSLRGFIYAAAPMAVDKLRQCLKIFGPVMMQSFGQAESPMFCTLLMPEDHLVLGDPAREHRLASCGRPTLLTPVAIMGDDGKLMPRGERGEIVVRGNLVMKGYYKNPEATADVSQHGWHHTGDVGYLDADGYLYIVDRKKDMIISGGFNVYPSEVEQVIWAHPAVQDCAVIGVPDEKWGEAVKAVIELKPGARLDPDEIIRICKQQLGSVKAPKSVAIWDELPRSPVGKVRKKDIRDVFWQGQTRKI